MRRVHAKSLERLAQELFSIVLPWSAMVLHQTEIDTKKQSPENM